MPLTLGLALSACIPQATPGITTLPEIPPTSSPAPTSTSSPTPQVLPTPTPTPHPLQAILDEGLSLGEVAYKIPLTIRHVTQHAATLFFEIDTPANGRLLLRSVDAGRIIIERTLDPTQSRHLHTVDGLDPGVRYDVIVVIQEGDADSRQPVFLGRAWGPVRFRTQAMSGPLRFGVIGDASFGDDVTISLVEQMAAADLDFVVHTGDVVDETEWGVDPFESYAQKFFTPFEPLLSQMPVYTVPGNHDYDLDIRWQEQPFYYHAFPAFDDPSIPSQGGRERNQYYAFVYGDVQFVMLDSQVLYGVAGREEQNQWLTDRLAEPGFHATIPVFHVAPFSSSAVHPENSLAVRNAWAPLFQDANIPLVLSGHFHNYERFIVNGITYIVSSGGSSTLYATGDLLSGSEAIFRKSHYVLGELDGEILTLSAISLGGDLLDTAQVTLD
jgi:predicted phosphodiesterase